ncbi:MAG: sigma-70 family RNA polymerase sigma factor [Gaiellales bacterium]|nr:MAG: sigma-70 family RNA polymerase sigma factor [Gaiellales bacterium]
MKPDLLNDAELVDLAQEGDGSAMEELVSRYEDKVYNLAVRMVGNREDAEDVLQDTFLNVIRSLGSFRGKSSFSTWLYRITANAALTRLRKRSRKEKSEGEFLDEVYSVKQAAQSGERLNDWSDSPAKRLLSEEAKAMMGEAINELPEKYRTVFVLRDVEGLPASDVAEILDLSVPAVKSRLHRARMFLRNHLSHYYAGEME